MATFLAHEINATDRDVTGPTEQVQIQCMSKASRQRARKSPRFFAKIEHGQISSKLCMPICLYV